eukprot:g5973.t1
MAAARLLTTCLMLLVIPTMTAGTRLGVRSGCAAIMQKETGDKCVKCMKLREKASKDKGVLGQLWASGVNAANRAKMASGSEGKCVYCYPADWGTHQPKCVENESLGGMMSHALKGGGGGVCGEHHYPVIKNVNDEKGPDAEKMACDRWARKPCDGWDFACQASQAIAHAGATVGGAAQAASGAVWCTQHPVLCGCQEICKSMISEHGKLSADDKGELCNGGASAAGGVVFMKQKLQGKADDLVGKVGEENLPKLVRLLCTVGVPANERPGWFAKSPLGKTMDYMKARAKHEMGGRNKICSATCENFAAKGGSEIGQGKGR